MATFRTPVNLKDAKSQLRRLAKNLKVAEEARESAAAANYGWGVMVASDRIEELRAAVAHFEGWVVSLATKPL